jgi:hypothetical protein
MGVGGVSLAARHGQCGQAQKANAIRGAQIFSLLCELASDQRQPTRADPPDIFSLFFVLLSCLSSSCSDSCILTSSCFASTYCSLIELNSHISAATPPPAPQIYIEQQPAAADAPLPIHATGIIS